MDSSNKKVFSGIEDAVTALKKGKVIIIVDDFSEDNEGVLFQPAEKVTV